MFTISKSFHFDYSHRVWVQKLREDFCAAGDCGTKCKNQHGHTGVVKVWVEGEELNPQKMLMDFKELGFVKDFLDTYIDHKFILDRNDPLVDHLMYGKLNTDVLETLDGYNLKLLPVYVAGTEHLAGHKLGVSELDGIHKEFYESFFIVDFVPTSEELSRWCCEWAQAKLDQIDVKVSKVSWSETPKSIAVYEN